MKAGIVVDTWKLPIFERHLAQAGYTHTTAPGITAGTSLITVETPAVQALAVVVRAANDEAANVSATRH